MRDNTAILFGSPEDFFAFVLGAPQHDAHMQAYRCRRNLDRMAAQGDAGCASIEQWQAEQAAERHGYNTAVLRQHLHRWEAGCFSREPYAPTRVRVLRRALDIAIEHHARAA